MTTCADCSATIARWRRVRYDPQHPSEWPGGQVLMDNRRSHAERRADWDTKTTAQIALIERICADNHSTPDA